MAKIYRVSGLQSSGTASTLARAITAIDKGLRVRVDAEHGLVDVTGNVSDFMVADTIKKVGCQYLGIQELPE
ncbi:MAG: hypothetical protein EB059_02800 [Alphaproteobacteria bacterium]|nr:hypothetical protein [Alphaproteobacteria bacterium]